MALTSDEPAKPRVHKQRLIRFAIVSMVFVLLLCGVLAVFESSLAPETVKRLHDTPAAIESAQLLARPSDGFAGELMTPELIAEIERRPKHDCLSPMQTHGAHEHRGDPAGVQFACEARAPTGSACGRWVRFPQVLLFYKYGGIVGDADTSPVIPAPELEYPKECDVIFGKENFIPKEAFTKPTYRRDGVGKTYPFNRPFQVLNWAMAASKPRNPHVKRLIEMSMMHFFGLRDMEFDFIQDVAGSGLMIDYMALLHEREGRSYERVYDDRSTIPVQDACLTDGYLTGDWIKHEFIDTWKQ